MASVFAQVKIRLSGFGVAPLRSSPGYAGVDNQTSHCWFAEIKLVIAGNYKNLAASTFNHRGEPNIG